jgi:hypothetical protein
LNPSSTYSCNQPQSLSLASNSPSVVAQGNIWQINIGQMYSLPASINTLQVDTQGQFINGVVLLSMIDNNQQQTGPYASQMNVGSPLVFQNLPSTPVSILQLQFPNGAQSNSYLVNVIICPQPGAAPTTYSTGFLTF